MTRCTERYEKFTDTSLFHPYDDVAGTYLASHVSVAGGKMRFDCDQSGGWGGWFGKKSLERTRVSIGIQGFGGDASTGMVVLLWPTNDVWTDGEMDIAEAAFQGETIKVNHHGLTNPGSNFITLDSGVTWAGRHYISAEPLADGTRYWMDGTLLGKITSDKPVGPHRFTFQSKPAPGSAPAYALVDAVTFEYDV